MAKVRTFRIHPQYGVPDKNIQEFLSQCEQEEGIITVTTTFIPGDEKAEVNDRLTVIVTKLDDNARIEVRSDTAFRAVTT